MHDSANTDCMTKAFPVLLVALLQLSFIYHRMPKRRECISWLSDVPLPATSEGHGDDECKGPVVPQAGRP